MTNVFCHLLIMVFAITWLWSTLQNTHLNKIILFVASVMESIPLNIVDRRDWLWSRANIKGANKDAKIYVGRSTILHNLLFCSHTLCMNYVTNTFLLVSSSVRSKQLNVFCAGSRPKKRTKTYNKELCRVSQPFPSLTMLWIINSISLNYLLQIPTTTSLRGKLVGTFLLDTLRGNSKCRLRNAWHIFLKQIQLSRS